MVLDVFRERSAWYDRYGQPITFERFEALRLDSEYWLVSETVVPVEGELAFLVSTVWTGSYPNPDGPPRVFETAVCLSRAGSTQSELVTVRYATQDEALQGHLDTVAALSGNAL